MTLLKDKKIAFVVHSYPPFNGGSENYVSWMAEECQKQGAHVIVYAGQHKGIYNNISVMSDTSHLLYKKYHDLVVVHGSNVSYQDNFLKNAKQINKLNPILFLPVLPRYSKIEKKALLECDFWGYSTVADDQAFHRLTLDVEIIAKKLATKIYVPHGIPHLDRFKLIKKYKQIGGKNAILNKLNILPDANVFYSGGGFWKNKGHKELADHFNKNADPRKILIVTGYGGDKQYCPEQTEFVKPLFVEEKEHVFLYMFLAADTEGCYLMSSEEEGFGLVLLEASYLRIPWLSTTVAGSREIVDDLPVKRDSSYQPRLFPNVDSMVKYIYKHPVLLNIDDLDALETYVLQKRMITNTIKGIYQCLIPSPF